MSKFKLITFCIPAFVSLLCLLSLNSCTSGEESGSKEEGQIEFDTKGVDPTHPMYGFAPSEATLKYKKDKFIFEMSTMGMFNTSIIIDNTAKTVAQSVKFLDLKQACIENEKDIAEANANYVLKIEETNETKDIVGLKAYKAKVTLVKDPSIKFDVWYTKELGLENANVLTPYAQLKGLLLDYRIEKFGIELHFLAKSIKNIEIPDKTFEIPASMKIISTKEMEEFIKNLQQ